MITYERKAKNIALAYYPPNEELSEKLIKDLNIFFEDSENYYSIFIINKFIKRKK